MKLVTDTDIDSNWTEERVAAELTRLSIARAITDAKREPSKSTLELRARIDEWTRRQQFGVTIPFKMKDVAKRLGGSWDGDRKQWLMPNAEAVAALKLQMENL